jgi:pyruvate,orthophosphate dikinase
MSWADQFKRLKVKANADTPEDALKAKNFGAEGIGLCRTEHMFFQKDRIESMRKMILSSNVEERESYLNELLPFQKKDFKAMMRTMDNLPMIIRLLDPPLHEFLPHTEDAQEALCKKMGISKSKLLQTISELHEFNPMLGFRGCRLGIKYPEITKMQIKAIFLAAIELSKEGLTPLPYIEVPLVATLTEYTKIKALVEQIAIETGAKGHIQYKIGTMIEVPRAALIADKLAKECDFFSFGTNDLTQMTCGLSRDDAGKFLPVYVKEGIYQEDPFVTIDKEGVGKLMKSCVELARPANSSLEIGICGEHGGDPSSVEFCDSIGLDDVSCSPYRVVVARLAAAHAAIKANKANK